MKIIIIIAFLYIILVKYVSSKIILFDSMQIFLLLFILLWLSVYKHPVFYIVIILCIIIWYEKLKPLKAIYYLYNLYQDEKYYPRLGYNLFRDLEYPIKHNFHKLPETPSLLLLNYPSDLFEYFLNGVIPKKTCFVVSKKAKFCMYYIHQKELIFSNIYKKNNLSYISGKIKNKIKSYFILAYVESSTKKYQIKSGMFVISKQLQIPVTPIFIGKLQNNIGYLPIVVGKSFIVKDVKKEQQRVRKFYRKNMKNYYGSPRKISLVETVAPVSTKLMSD